MLARFPANRIQKLRGVSCFANDQDEGAFELVGWEFRMARCQIYGGALQLSAVILQV